MSSTLDNLDIVRSFLTEKETRLANAELRITSTLYARQLLDARGKTIATMAHSNALDTDPASVVSVRRQTEFWSLLNEALQDGGFAPQEAVKQSEFTTFKQLAIPEGYRLRLTEARFMWRTWWTQQRGQRRSLGLQMQLLIRSRDNWYPVQDVACNQGTLFIKTLVGEMALQGADQVVWLERRGSAPDTPRAAQQINQLEQPSSRSQPSQATRFSTGNPLIRNTSANNTQTSQSSRLETPSASPDPAPNSGSSSVQNRDSRQNSKVERTSSSTSLTDVPSTGSMSSSGKVSANALNIPAEWQSVVRQTGGKLYIRTEKGYIVVKGEQLSIALQPHQSATQSSRTNSAPGSPNGNSQLSSTSAGTPPVNSAATSSMTSSRRRLFR